MARLYVKADISGGNGYAGVNGVSTYDFNWRGTNDSGPPATAADGTRWVVGAYHTGSSTVDYISYSGGATLYSGPHSFSSGNGKYWYLNVSGNGYVTVHYKSAAPTYYYVTVNYHNNGGTGAPSSQDYSGTSSNISCTLSNTKPTRSGHTFLGWSTDRYATSAQYSAGATTTFGGSTGGSTVDLYAIWRQDSYSYTITYHYKNSSGTALTAGRQTESNTSSSKNHKMEWPYDVGAREYNSSGTSTYSIYFDANGGSGSASRSGVATTNYRWIYDSAAWYDGFDGSGTKRNADSSYSFSGNTDVYAKYTSSATDYWRNSLTERPPTPARSFYTFTGKWMSTSSYISGITVLFDNNQDAFRNTTLETVYAQWEAIEYSITYELNGGTNPSGVRTSYTVESSAYTLPTPTKTNARFDGWYLTSDLSGPKVTSIQRGSYGNKTYYAKWTSVYTITLNNQSATSAGTRSVTVTGGTPSIDPITIPSKEGFKFGGYYDNTEARGTRRIDEAGNWVDTSFSGNATIYAYWIPIYSVNFRYYDYSTDTYKNLTGYPKNVVRGDSLTIPAGSDQTETRTDNTIIFDSNYGEWSDGSTRKQTNYTSHQIRVFSSWGGLHPGESTGPIQSDTTYTAIFAEGERTYDRSSFSFPSNPVRENYEFIGWTKVRNGDTLVSLDDIYSDPDGYSLLYARWKEESWWKYQLKYNLNPGELSSTPSDPPKTYATSASLKVGHADPVRTGFKFLGWTEAGVLAYYHEGDTVLVERTSETVWSTISKTLTANWSRETYILTLDAGPYISSQGTPEIKITYGVTDLSQITITNPTRADGYKFEGYFTASDSSGAKIIDNSGKFVSGITNTTFTKNTTLYAHWSEIIQNVSLSSDGNGSVTGPSSARRTTVVTISATPNTGYKFKEWVDLDTGVQVSTSASYSFVILKDINYEARFDEIEYTVRYEFAQGSMPGTGQESKYADKVYKYNDEVVIPQASTLTIVPFYLTLNLKGGSSISGGTHSGDTLIRVNRFLQSYLYGNNQYVFPGNSYRRLSSTDGSVITFRTIIPEPQINVDDLGTPVYNPFRFKCWSTSGDVSGGTLYWPGDTFILTGDRTIYARYQARIKIVAQNPDTSGQWRTYVVNRSTDDYYDLFSTVTINAAKESWGNNFQFINWELAGSHATYYDNKQSVNISVTDNYNITANFNEIFTIFFNDNNETSNYTEIKGQIVGNSVRFPITSRIPVYEGHDFRNKWTTNEDGTGDAFLSGITYTISKSRFNSSNILNLFAAWDLSKYRIDFKVSPEDSGIIGLRSSTESPVYENVTNTFKEYQYGTVLNVLATQTSDQTKDFTFDSIKAEFNGGYTTHTTPTWSYTITQPAVLTAIFKGFLEISVQFDRTGGEVDLYTLESGSYVRKQTKRIELNNDIVLKVYSVSKGDSVRIVASPKDVYGYTWGGDLEWGPESINSPVEFTAENSVLITCNFLRQRYFEVVSSNSSEGFVTPVNPVRANVGSTQTITITPVVGYDFKYIEWYANTQPYHRFIYPNNCTKTGNMYSYSLSVDDSINEYKEGAVPTRFTAYFKEDTFKVVTKRTGGKSSDEVLFNGKIVVSGAVTHTFKRGDVVSWVFKPSISEKYIDYFDGSKHIKLTQDSGTITVLGDSVLNFIVEDGSDEGLYDIIPVVASSFSSSEAVEGFYTGESDASPGEYWTSIRDRFANLPWYPDLPTGGQCTWYANSRSGRMRNNPGACAPYSSLGHYPNASEWHTRCSGNWIYDNVATVGGVGVLVHGQGMHVVVVEKIENGIIYISENNYGSATNYTLKYNERKLDAQNYVFINNYADKVAGSTTAQTGAQTKVDYITSTSNSMGYVIGGGKQLAAGTITTIEAIPYEGCEFCYWVTPSGDKIESSVYTIEVSKNTAGIYTGIFKREGEIGPNPDIEGIGTNFISKYFGYSYNYIKNVDMWNYDKNTWSTGPDKYSYDEIEFIESTKEGQQWIATDWHGNNRCKVIIDGAFMSSAGSQLAGSAGLDEEFHFGIVDNKFIFKTSTSTSTLKADTSRHTFVIDGSGSNYIDNTLVSTEPLKRTLSNQIKLFSEDGHAEKDDTSTVIENQEFRLYSCKIYDGDELVRDYVPAIRTLDNTPGLWDKVSHRFSLSMSESHFIAGPKTGKKINKFEGVI